MGDFLCISVRFLKPYFHGRDENGAPEWPPSPLRLLQALVAASAGRWNERSQLRHAAESFRWFESLLAPTIVAADSIASKSPYRLYVADNVADKVAAAWSRGRGASIADYRKEKDVRPTLLADDFVHYLYELSECESQWRPAAEIVQQAARSITHIGWGIDMVVGDASILTREMGVRLKGVRWYPAPGGETELRVPRSGTVDNLMGRHASFLNRLGNDTFHPVSPLRVFNNIPYRRNDESPGRPWSAFELRNLDGSRFRYPHRKLIHIAGTMRHLAVQVAKRNAPSGVGENWAESYVAGHVQGTVEEHRQLSYLPLPSLGHKHTDPGIRRVMIAAPVGDDDWLDQLARRLAGLMLKPDPEQANPFSEGEAPLLVPLPKQTGDGVVIRYTKRAAVWDSFTPVILPGHDDHRPAKTRALIARALVQSGIEQPCEFEWSPYSRFPKSYSAHKYDQQKRPQGYFRPTYLNSKTAVHLTLRFHDGSEARKPVNVPGPIVIGAGRHCGLGILAAGEHE